MDYQEVNYQDKLLPDKSVERVYSDGRREIRRKLSNTQIEWEDDDGNAGMDEALGDKVIKRSHQDGRTIYGRDQGYGRTAWSDGLLTLNKSSFGGKIGGILAGIGVGVLIGSLIDPPEFMSLAEEEELRRKRAQSQVVLESEWDDDDFGFDDDFG